MSLIPLPPIGETLLQKSSEENGLDISDSLKKWLHDVYSGTNKYLTTSRLNSSRQLVATFDFPSISTDQIMDLQGVPEGRSVYDSTIKKLKFWNGTAWETITST